MDLKLILTATALCIAGHSGIAEELTGTLENQELRNDHDWASRIVNSFFVL